jgi:hypothetical protein
MNNRNEGSSRGAMLICGIGEGRLRSGGAGMGDGGSISNGARFISLLRLRGRLEL